MRKGYVKCLDCGKEIFGIVEACPHCDGERIEVFCWQCGETNQILGSNCTACGQFLDPAKARKLQQSYEKMTKELVSKGGDIGIPCWVWILGAITGIPGGTIILCRLVTWLINYLNCGEIYCP